ncbi:DEAD/DEAH box helicase [Micromonospora sp. WMMD712]|uniref:DEAD/DEAH box helicase n=1 Tax=Micromonospora sp. WMMD712 TaxID=3016096 RepID=UPI00249B2091|nr:DEAD/DEAH box helicase [Micromonospora sp. WMMD712]WFE57882.1 DEAD/DEAH box helicase [Micromonospora sp. WMMD712]
MTNDITATPGAVKDDLAWNTAWQSLSVALNEAREITRLIRLGQTTSVQKKLLSLAEYEFFRVASGITEEHPQVLRGRAALLERHPQSAAAFEEVWRKSGDVAAKGHLLHALIAGTLTDLSEEFGFRPNSSDTDLRIRQESIWCWYELVLAGLDGRESVGKAAYKPNQGIYPNDDTPKSRKDWALRRTRAGSKGAQGEQLAARDIVRRVGSSIEPVPQQLGQVDSLSGLDQMLPPSLAAATRRRLARYSGTPQLTSYQAETIPILAKALGAGENMLLSAVTGSGKSLLGQLAAGYVVGRRELGHRNRRAVIALPLKALVGDVVDELTDWFMDAGLQFRVLGGSRDYPENVEDLASGRYEVAVMIYETLDAYLSSGQDPLKGCRVLIVDELQYLDDEGRGPRLESMLTKVRLNYPRLPIIGISAVLSQDSRARLAEWLDVDQERHRHTAERPVSLDVRAYDGFVWRKLRDTSAISDHEDDASSGSIEESQLDLKSQMLSDWAKDDGAKHSILARASSGGNMLAPAVVVQKLRENSDLRILVYTRSRKSAFSLAQAIQAAMDLEFGAVRRTRNNPWRFGRYRDESLATEVAEERRQRLTRTAAHGARKDVETALMTGCAYHTRQLTRPLREIVQDEFRNGLLRVLVTTDTLSVGLNLPVDAVVLASCTVSTGAPNGELRSLGLGDVKNRIGRAGRLGLSSSGDAWVLTEDAEHLHRKLRPNDETDVMTLSTVDGLWQRFILPRHGGTEVASRMTSNDMASLVLQDMTARGRSQPLSEHAARAKEIVNATLLAELAPGELPRAEDMLQRLIDRGLVAKLDAHGWKASPLGVAVAVNSLPLSTASVLERLADLAVSGASMLDLIAVAATSIPVRRLNWISMSPWDPDWTHGDLEQETAKSVGCLIAPLCAHGHDARRAADEQLLRELRQRDPNASLSPLPESVLCDQGHSDESAVVRLLANSDGLGDVNVVLRALVAYLWLHGVPFADIKGRVEAGTRYERERRRRRGRASKEVRRVELHLADVEQLCDQVSNVLSAADHFARHRDTGPRTQRLRPLSEAMWSGVPAWLTPLLNLHIEALHRERLIALPGDEEPEELRDLLTAPRLGLTEVEIEAARDALDAAERRQQRLQARLPVGLSEKPVADDPDAPSYGDYFTDFSLAEDLPEVIDLLASLLERYHLQVQAMADCVQFRLPAGRTGSLILAPERVTSAVVQQMLVDDGSGDEARALLCLNGMTDRARSYSQSALVPGRAILTGIDSLLALLNRSLRAGQDSGTPMAEAVFASFEMECGPVSVVLTSA